MCTREREAILAERAIDDITFLTPSDFFLSFTNIRPSPNIQSSIISFVNLSYSSILSTTLNSSKVGDNPNLPYKLFINNFDIKYHGSSDLTEDLISYKSLTYLSNITSESNI